MGNEDEPVLPRFTGRPSAEERRAEPLRAKIENLVGNQPYGVLCTQGENQPYGSLIAFSFAADLSAVVFATPVATRKYSLLSECDRVALVIDNRPEHVDNMMEVEAITATGRAEEIEAGARYDRCARLLLSRHPYLKAFVEAESSALFEIRITRFFHVTRFQEVHQWVPPSG